MEQRFAPPDDAVLDLVPYAFAVRANAVWTDMGSPEPQFSNAWEIYLHIRDQLRSTTWDSAFEQCLSTASQSGETPIDLGQDEDEVLVVDRSDDDGDIPIVDFTDSDAEDDEGELEG